MEHPHYSRSCAFLMLMVRHHLGGLPPGLQARQVSEPARHAGDHRRFGARAGPPTRRAGGQHRGHVPQQLGSHVPSSEAEVATLQADLMRAGFRSENAAAGVFRHAHHGHSVACWCCASCWKPSMPPNPVMKIGLMVSGCGAGWILPRFFLEKKVTKRQEILRLVAARRAGSAGGLGGSRPGPGPGHPARGARTASAATRS